MTYDALLVLSFGGPETRDDVLPFLRNVLRGRNVPEERMLEVAEHYYHFGGHSPINQQNRDLIAALEKELEQHGPQLPVYWGNRNWSPYLVDTLQQMKEDGVKKALAYVTSAFSSYSGCRQYRENILAAQAQVGEGAPQVDKLRVFYNHPGFIGPMTENVQAALQKIPAEFRERAQVVYTAHSVPMSMAQGSRYVPQLEESCRLISSALQRTGDTLGYQSRSGPPSQPWLEPDILAYLRLVKESNSHPAVVICPLGFTSDHMEVMYDLDTEAQELAHELRLPMVRAATVGIHPRFITMIRELIMERMDPVAPRRALGAMGPSLDVCPVDCCPAPQRPGGAAVVSK